MNEYLLFKCISFKALTVLSLCKDTQLSLLLERVVSTGRDLGSLTNHLICVFQLRSEYMQLYASKVSEGMALQLGCLELRYVLARQKIASDTSMFGKHVSRVKLLWPCTVILAKQEPKSWSWDIGKENDLRKHEFKKHKQSQKSERMQLGRNIIRNWWAPA